MPAIEVFELMCRLKVSGVGVTNECGDELIANLAGRQGMTPGISRPPRRPLLLEHPLL
jgi:hypothetical protein